MQILRRSMPGLGRVDSDLTRLCRWWCLPALARRDAPTPWMPSKSAHLPAHLPFQNHLSRFLYKRWRPCPLVPMAHSFTRCLCTQNVTMPNHELECKSGVDYVYLVPVISDSSHRDGLIYKNKYIPEDFPEGDIADRNETKLEPMMFSKDTKRCSPVGENCSYHGPTDMFQFYSVRLSKSPVSSESIQLYGYIAARDVEDGMLNYVVNYSRDDPIAVQQGSLIEMTGPKRGIIMGCIVLIEFDMRIKNGMHKDDDQQLIDGAISYYDHTSPGPIKHRIFGNCGAVDMSLGIVPQAVEATIEVVISEVRSGLSLSLSSSVDVIDEYEEIQLFHGTIAQSGALRRFVVALSWSTMMLLKFKVGDDVGGRANRQIKFQAKKHGCNTRRIKLKVAAISVKVTWSAIPRVVLVE